MNLEVLQYPDPRLKRKSEPVAAITDEILALAAQLAETMYEHEGIGLAAPQVGRFVRMITIDLSGPDKREALQVYVNPVLEPLPPLEGDDDYLETEEGCLSVPDYRSSVKRHTRVRLKALGLDGQPLERDVTDLESICLQHECDHLDGKLFIDRISRLKRGLYDGKIKKKLKAEQADQGLLPEQQAE
ncbi:MAG: peptide deformylase [Deltaproteobacteria bacterium]|jgi:peptide deformylase|nr:peptide deformylase [Deltaproteobacteria bacterium]